MNIPVSRPYIGTEEKEAVMRVLDSGQFAQGKTVAQFENEFAAYHQAQHAVAVNNGTSALTAALMAHGVGAGDEVIVPAFTFFATASSVLSVGAKAVFADIDPLTYCLNPAAVEAAVTPRTKAVIMVHLYGLIGEIEAVQSICQRHNLALIEDAAQAHAAARDGKFVGSWGTCTFSFYATKNIMTGEGGMILNNDDGIDHRLRAVRNQGMHQTYYHELLGYNFRMTEIAAAIGLAQLARLSDWTDERIRIASYYNTHLEAVTTPFVPEGAKHVYHQYTVRVQEGADRDAIVKGLNERGIAARIYYPVPQHRQPVFAAENANVTLPETERAAREVFSLPIFPSLTAEERAYVVEEVNKLTG